MRRALPLVALALLACPRAEPLEDPSAPLHELPPPAPRDPGHERDEPPPTPSPPEVDADASAEPAIEGDDAPADPLRERDIAPVPARPRPSAEQGCDGHAEGEEWKEECNTCICKGGLPTCTTMACLGPR